MQCLESEGHEKATDERNQDKGRGSRSRGQEKGRGQKGRRKGEGREGGGREPGRRLSARTYTQIKLDGGRHILHLWKLPGSLKPGNILSQPSMRCPSS